MALVKAVIAGAVTALAVPYVMRGNTDQLGDWLRRGVVYFNAGDYVFAWSWPLFCIVTLFAWGITAWADK